MKRKFAGILLVLVMLWETMEALTYQSAPNIVYPSFPNDGPQDKLRPPTIHQNRIMRFLLSSMPQSYIDSLRGSPNGIPFRPIRRIGSEFLGKRSSPPNEEWTRGREAFESEEESVKSKRKVGSEFLGKRRLGSEFLGKRSSQEHNGKDMDEDEYIWESLLEPNFEGAKDESLVKSKAKKALGNEFLGKRSSSYWYNYDLNNKRNRLGSEFLGKRRIGSEFLGKRDLPVTMKVGTIDEN